MGGIYGRDGNGGFDPNIQGEFEDAERARVAAIKQQEDEARAQAKATADAAAEETRRRQEDLDGVKSTGTTETATKNEPSSNAKQEAQNAAKGKGPKARAVSNERPELKIQDVPDAHHPSIGGKMFQALMKGWWSLSPLTSALIYNPLCAAGGLVSGVGNVSLGAATGVGGVVLKTAGAATNSKKLKDYATTSLKISSASFKTGAQDIGWSLINIPQTVIRAPIEILGGYFSTKLAGLAESKLLRFHGTTDQLHMKLLNDTWEAKDKHGKPTGIFYQGNPHNHILLAARLNSGIDDVSRVAPDLKPGAGGKVGEGSLDSKVDKNPTLTAELNPGLDDDVVEMHDPSQSPRKLDSFQRDLGSAVAERNKTLPSDIRRVSSAEPTVAADIAIADAAPQQRSAAELAGTQSATQSTPTPNLGLSRVGSTIPRLEPTASGATELDPSRGGTLELRVRQANAIGEDTRRRFGAVFGAAAVTPEVPELQQRESTRAGLNQIAAESPRGSQPAFNLFVKRGGKGSMRDSFVVDEPAAALDSAEPRPSATLRQVPVSKLPHA